MIEQKEMQETVNFWAEKTNLLAVLINSFVICDWIELAPLSVIFGAIALIFSFTCQRISQKIC